MHLIPQAAQKQKTLISMLEAYTGCTFVPSNTTMQMPSYPYVSFNVINTATRKGTYSVTTQERDGALVEVRYIPLSQKFSFTAQSDNDAEAQEKAMLIVDFFEAKRIELADNDITVADVGAITPRDNLLTISYEYRKGLDVELSYNNIVEAGNTETVDKIVLNDAIEIN